MKPNTSDWCPYKKKEIWREQDMKTQGKDGHVQTRYKKVAWSRTFPHDSPKKFTLLTPWYQTSHLQNMRKYIYVNPLSPWYIIIATLEIHSDRRHSKPDLPLLIQPLHNLDPWNYKLLEASTMDEHKVLCVLIFTFHIITFCTSTAKKSPALVELPSSSTSQ